MHLSFPMGCMFTSSFIASRLMCTPNISTLIRFTLETEHVLTRRQGHIDGHIEAVGPCQVDCAVRVSPTRAFELGIG